MLEDREISKKLWGVIKNKHPKLDDVEIQKKVDNLMELAFFLIRLWSKDHARASENHLSNDFSGNSRDSPD